jgi:hypothetical protein
MSEKRSIIVFEHFHEGRQRFEYFIAGVSTALCAYVGQTLRPQKFGFNSYTLEVLSVGLVVASIILSFKRIENGVFLNQLNHDLLHRMEVRGELDPRTDSTDWEIFANPGEKDQRCSGEGFKHIPMAKLVAALRLSRPVCIQGSRTIHAVGHSFPAYSHAASLSI